MSGQRLLKNRIYDAMHKGTVSVLIGFTGISTLFLAYKGAHWLIVTRPKIREEYRIRMEDKMRDKQIEEANQILHQDSAELLKE